MNENCDKNYPNCVKCEWSELIDYEIIGIRQKCMAQGMRNCSDVYANEYCIKIYKEKS